MEWTHKMVRWLTAAEELNIDEKRAYCTHFLSKCFFMEFLNISFNEQGFSDDILLPYKTSLTSTTF